MAYLDRSIHPEVKRLFDIDFGHAEELFFPNGMKVIVGNDVSDSDVVRVDLMMKGGKWNQKHILQALFTSRMLREGTPHHTSGQISEVFDYYGAWTEFSSSMSHSYVSMYSLGKFLKPTVDMLHEIVTEPLFDENELRTVANINKQNFMVNSAKVEYLSQKGLLQMMFGEKHPVGAYASAEDYDTINREILCDFYSRYYNSNNTIVYLSGNVSDSVIDVVCDTFGKSSYGVCMPPYEEKVFAIVTSADNFRKQHVEHSLQTSLRMGLFIPERTHEDYHKLRILITVFGGYFGSRLMQNIREDKGYTYGISAGTAFYPGTGLMIISTEVNSDCYEKVICEVKNEMSRLREELIGDDEMESVRSFMMGELMRTFEGAFSIADTRMFLEATGLDENFYRESLDVLKNVTPYELREMAEKYFNPENLKVSAVGNI